MEEDIVLNFKAASDTQWISHIQAISTIRKILPSHFAHLEEQAEHRGDALLVGIVHETVLLLLLSIY